MTYQTLYRKYRSNDLNELIGQQHIIKTISNAIEHERLTHAYIFSGPRGTGKTSTARILAKMVNKTKDDMAECLLCEKIGQGNCVDVIEIDAASHTGVDYMRQLIDQVQFLPVEAKYKVFIIDEVHMLSTGAFNALLKTLEEPPQQVLFILATTELHKIPATIQSRAQTLHFRLLDHLKMKEHLQKICSLEGYSIDDEALEKIVNVANGGMRDGLSLLDQLMSVSEDNHIKVVDVSMVLGSVDDSQIIAFLTKCFEGQKSAHSDLIQLFESGVDVFQFYDDIINYLHYHFLVNGSHSFAASDQVISSWLKWFCDQIAYLKMANDPAIAAQVSLFNKLAMPDGAVLITSQPQVSHEKPPATIQVESRPEPKDLVKNKQVITDSPSAKVRDSDTSAKQVEHNLATTDNSKKNLRSDSIDDDILNKVGNEFPVLKPVVKGAKLLVRGSTLCLVLEETYQFFEKKLSEVKFKDCFLAHYNKAKSLRLTEWYVTSDVNTVYEEIQDDSNLNVNNATENENNKVKSKTVNQIIEMFEGQIIQ